MGLALGSLALARRLLVLRALASAAERLRQRRGRSVMRRAPGCGAHGEVRLCGLKAFCNL